jgi:hypothetical protein
MRSVVSDVYSCLKRGSAMWIKEIRGEHTRNQQSPLQPTSTCTPNSCNPYTAASQSGNHVSKSSISFHSQETHPVEAGMALWQLRWIARLLDGKPTRPVRALEVLEPVDGDTRSAGRELEQARLALGWPAADALPEPLDDFIVELVAAVVGKLGPVVATEKVSLRINGCWEVLTRRSRTYHR